MGFTGWYAVARMVSDELAALSTRDFALAARASGVPTVRMLRRHLLPHLAPMLMTAGAFSVASTISLEAGLSFLGLGIQPPTASWGNIMREGAGAVQTEWWLTVFPGLATVLPVLACNAVGDALRDRFVSVQFAESAPPSAVAPSLQQRP
jgi:peptide/nickel transport system permease protein